MLILILTVLQLVSCTQCTHHMKPASVREAKTQQGQAKAAKQEADLGNILQVKQEREFQQAAMAAVRDARQQQSDSRLALQKAAKQVRCCCCCC